MGNPFAGRCYAAPVITGCAETFHSKRADGHAWRGNVQPADSPLVNAGIAQANDDIQHQRLSKRLQDGVTLAAQDLLVPSAVHCQGTS